METCDIIIQADWLEPVISILLIRKIKVALPDLDWKIEALKMLDLQTESAINSNNLQVQHWQAIMNLRQAYYVLYILLFSIVYPD